MKCKCGCGKTTNILKKTNNKIGYKKGEYRNYISGHNSRGRIFSEETKQKLRENHWMNRPDYSPEKHHLYGKKRPINLIIHKGNKYTLGYKHTEKAKQKMKESHMNNKYRIGTKHSKETKELMKIKKLENNNPNWKGGISFEPYGLEFNNQLKEQIRKRDKYRCQECNYIQKQLRYKLSVHHIDYNKQNNNTDNLISLCGSCHIQTNYSRNDWQNYFEGKIER